MTGSTHTHTHTYIHTHIHTHTHIYICIHTHTYIYIYIKGERIFQREKRGPDCNGGSSLRKKECKQKSVLWIMRQ